MSEQGFSVSALVEARAEAVYAAIADYHDRHQRIIPKPPFESLEVEEGGTGGGTVIRLRMRVLGRVQATKGVVTEPEPGRLLVEAYDSGYVTSFRVEPVEGGRHARVTIATELPRAGIVGAVERWLVERMLRPVYVEELKNLERVARESGPGARGFPEQ